MIAAAATARPAVSTVLLVVSAVTALIAAFYIFGTFAELRWPEGIFEIVVFG
jgi:hypothetical protein